MEALSHVQDPELHRDLVSLGMVRDVQVQGDCVTLTVVLTTPACPLKDRIRRDVEAALRAVEGVNAVEVTMTARERRPEDGPQPVPGIRHVILVGSGKGGVGKSTVSVNLALALARSGARVGLLDADILGPSIPLMTGATERPPIVDGNRVAPIERHGIRLMSVGLLLDADQAVIWRGPKISGFLLQMFSDVAWGELDYLVVDLPPGTGDVQLTLAQKVAVAGAVLVTTPQAVALGDVLRAKSMFERTGVPLLGLLENMSYFRCPCCNERTDIFSHGGGRQAADRMAIPFLGEIPLDPAIRAGGDAGEPVVRADPDSPVTAAFLEAAATLARSIEERSSPCSGCAAVSNLEEALERAAHSG